MGNLTHWIDLMCHMLFWRHDSCQLSICVYCSDDSVSDENIVLVVKSSLGDLFYSEFFSHEGALVGEFLKQLIFSSSVIARISNFLRLEIESDSGRTVKTLRSKDAGHRNAVLQPFATEYASTRFEESLVSHLALTLLRVTF